MMEKRIWVTISGVAQHFIFLFLIAFHVTVEGFEIFSEQQLLVPNDPDAIFDFNNSEVGQTHIDDYWTKVDINYSPLDGWSLYRHLRLGCFTVKWNSADRDAEDYSQLMGPELTDQKCVDFCNRTQAYFRFPTCRCTEDFRVQIEEVDPCRADSWEVFREYDFRSSMSPSTFDVPRRLLYSVVTVRVPHLQEEDTVRHYLHAVNALEAKPKFPYDLRLERMVFNMVWDFGKSRLCGLSFKNWGARLDFTIISFNTSTGVLISKQLHFPLQDQIQDQIGAASGSMLSQGMASADGLATVDILFGTYYTVVPTLSKESQRVTHVVVAIDIEKKSVLSSTVLPITLMNLQINALQHKLYGAGMQPSGHYAYYELCRALNFTQRVGTVTRMRIEVVCDYEVLGQLPGDVSYIHLQSAAIDHQYNYAWFMYKRQATGRPLMLEYHHNDKDYVQWRSDSVPENAAYVSLLQTVPRIIFSLYPPVLKYAKFAPSGTKILVAFDSPTLRGAIPIDLDGDEVPDIWNNADKVIRDRCERFFDDFTMKLIPGSMCQWTTDANLFIELMPQSTIIPGDLLRVRGNAIYAGKKSPSGVSLFSQPSADFTVVENPDVIPIPVVSIAGNNLVDTCTSLFLDGTASYNHGFRGTFVWMLDSTNPPTSEPHMRQIEKVIRDNQPVGQSHQQVTIPPNILQGNHDYIFTLRVISFWDPEVFTNKNKLVRVSADPVPPLFIFGPPARSVSLSDSLAISSQGEPAGCKDGSISGRIEYTWTGCYRENAVPSIGDSLKCSPALNGWDLQAFGANLTGITGIKSRSIFIAPFTLQAGRKYLLVVNIAVYTTLNGVAKILKNEASLEVEVVFGPLVAAFKGGNGYGVFHKNPLVVDGGASKDPDDLDGELGQLQFAWACVEKGTELPCFNGVAVLTNTPCAAAVANASGTFDFQARPYPNAQGITVEPYSPTQNYCMQPKGVLIVKPEYFGEGEYVFNMTVSKLAVGKLRTVAQQITVKVEVVELPLVIIKMTPKAFYVPTNALRFEGVITNEFEDTTYSYVWSAFRWGVNPEYDRDLATIDPDYNVNEYTYVPLDPSVLDFNNPEQIRTPIGSRFLVTVPGVLSAGVNYKFRLEITDNELLARGVPSTGFAEMAFDMRGMPPSGGKLVSSNLTGTAYETLFTFSLTGWGSEDTPLVYQFGYKLDNDDEFEEITLLSNMFSDQNFIRQELPQGKTQPNNRLKLWGYVRSSLGVVTSIPLELSVGPPSDVDGAIGRLKEDMDNLEAGSAVNAMMGLIDLVEGGDIAELEGIFDALMSKSGEFPATTTAIASQTKLLTKLSDKGLKNNKVIDYVGDLTGTAISLTTFDEERGEVPHAEAKDDVFDSLSGVVDSLMPGEAPEDERRRLKSMDNYGVHCDKLHCHVGDEKKHTQGRRLVSHDYRSPFAMYGHLQRCKGIQVEMHEKFVKSMYPGELPKIFYNRGQDVATGKESSLGNANPNAASIRGFEIPSLAFPGNNASDLKVFTYLFNNFKKWPYPFLALPENRSLRVPTPKDKEALPNIYTRRFVPNQGASSDQVWRAVSIQVGNEDGTFVNSNLNNAFQNLSYNLLPRVLARKDQTIGSSTDFSTSCYFLDLGQNLSEAYFESKGLVNDGDYCVTTHLSNFVVLIDDLATDLSTLEKDATDAFRSHVDQYKSLAMASGLAVLFMVALISAALGYCADQRQRDVVPVDVKQSRVVDAEDIHQKVIGTVVFTFKRDHLVIGMSQKHRKLTREKRVCCALVSWLAVEAIATLMHSRLDFPAESQWVATGLVAGVLSFPVLQFLVVLFIWQPRTRISHRVPPRSGHPQAIPLKSKSEPNPLHQPNQYRPPLPAHVAPPNKTAPRRAMVEMPELKLPVIPPGAPLKLPPLNPGDPERKIAPPPRPVGRPQPPQVPPPEEPLMAAIMDRSLDDLAVSHSSFGVPLPSLPALPQALTDGTVPAPPAKSSGKPRPPRAPPPTTKAFLLDSQTSGALPPLPPPANAQLALPAVPASRKDDRKPDEVPPEIAIPKPPSPPSTSPTSKRPELPSLPKAVRGIQAITSLAEMAGVGFELSHVKASSARGAPPPPPPPPRMAAPTGPAAPKTPRDGAKGALPLTLPTVTRAIGAFVAPPPPKGPVGDPGELAMPPPTPKGEGFMVPSALPPPGPPPKARPGSPGAPGEPPEEAAPGPPSRHLQPEAHHEAVMPPEVEMQPAPKASFHTEGRHAMMPRANDVVAIPKGQGAAPPPPPRKAPSSGGPTPPRVPPPDSQHVFTPNKRPPPPAPADLSAGGMLQLPYTLALPNSFDTSQDQTTNTLAVYGGGGGKPQPPPPPPGASTWLQRATPPPKKATPSLYPLPTPSEMAKELLPLQLGNSAKLPSQDLPPLPKLPVIGLAMNSLASIRVAPHPPGVPPPPPPLPIDAPIQPSEMPLPDKKNKNEIMLRKLVPLEEDRELGGMKPRPPPKRNSFKPTIPAGPPPSHAYILARKGAAPGTDIDVIPPPPPPVFEPKAPSIEPPKGELPERVREAYAHHIRKKVGEGITHEKHDSYPVPDYIVFLAQILNKVILIALMAIFIYYIIAFGTFLRPPTIWATHAATIVGTAVNLGVFETVKCLVVACVALVKDETRKKQAEVEARRNRMALKAQLIQGDAEKRFKALRKKMPKLGKEKRDRVVY